MGLIQPAEKVAVFIDGQFLMKGFHATRPGEYFSVEKVVKKLVAPGQFTRVGYYTAPPPPYLEEHKRRAHRRRMDSLRGCPFFDVFLGDMRQRRRAVMPEDGSQKVFGTCWEQKGVDVRIAIDMLGKAYRHEYDVAILVSGDSDFVEMVRLVKEASKHVLNATGPPNPASRFHPSQKLRRACDGHIQIDSAFLSDCLV